MDDVRQAANLGCRRTFGRDHHDKHKRSSLSKVPLSCRDCPGMQTEVQSKRPSSSLPHALVPLTIEHRTTGDYFGPQTPLTTQNSQLDTALSTLCRRTIIRWCDWLDAEIHLRTHRRWHESPACFDPDPETRHLAALGKAMTPLISLSSSIVWPSTRLGVAARAARYRGHIGVRTAYLLCELNSQLK
jgi:hypothetical protein